MANPVDIGSGFTAASSSTITLTTTGAVPAGAKILLAVAWFNTGVTINSISDGTYTYTVDKSQNSVGNTSKSAVASVDATTGLASGATITVNLSGASLSRGLAAVYVTGMKTGGAYGAVGQGQNSNTAWSSTTTTVTAGDLLWGCSHWEDSVTVTNTPSGGNTEVHDLTNAGSGFTTCYQVGTGAAIAAQGTWSTISSATDGTTSCAVAYPAAAAATAPQVKPLMLSLRKFGLPGRPFLGFPQIPFTPAGGVVFQQAVTADTVVVTGSLVRQTNKPLTATTVPVTSTLVRQVNKNLTAATVLVTATLAKLVSKFLTATTVLVTATLAVLKVILKTLTATTIVVTASLVRQVNKPLTATTVAVTASLQKQINKTLTATTVVVTATLAILKVILKALTATTVVVTSSLVRQVNKPMVATTVALIASLVKQIGKTIKATNVAVTASLLVQKVLLKALTATVSVTATLARQTLKPLTVTVSVAASVTKQIAHRMIATVGATASLVLDVFIAGAVIVTSYFSSHPFGQSGSSPVETGYQEHPGGQTGSSPSDSDFDAPRPRGQ